MSQCVNDDRPPLNLANLPGGKLIQQGLLDLKSETESVESLLVCIGYPRLRRLGLVDPIAIPEAPEIRLYRLLKKEKRREAYSQYNALIRRLVSFERAYEHQLRR